MYGMLTLNVRFVVPSSGIRVTYPTWICPTAGVGACYRTESLRPLLAGRILVLYYLCIVLGSRIYATLLGNYRCAGVPVGEKTSVPIEVPNSLPISAEAYLFRAGTGTSAPGVTR